MARIAGEAHHRGHRCAQQLCFEVAIAVRSTSKVYSSGRIAGNSIDDICRRTIGIRSEFRQESLLKATIAGIGKLNKIVSGLQLW